MQAQDYTYEAKCRRCGKITEWYFSNSDKFTYIEFGLAMADYIQIPRLHECEKCGMDTIQDVVSYCLPQKK